MIIPSYRILLFWLLVTLHLLARFTKLFLKVSSVIYVLILSIYALKKYEIVIIHNYLISLRIWSSAAFNIHQIF